MKNWLKVFFLFFILGLLVYFNSLNHKFLMDDYVFLRNPVLSQIKFIPSQWNPYREEELGVVDSQENLTYYRPMTHVVYDFCYATFKNNFWQHHLLNLFLFVFASSLIYLFIFKVTGNYNLAFLTGLLYLVHPINGIVINYISANVFSLQAICMMSTILLLLKALERNNDRGLYVLSLLFSFLSLFWHDSGAMTLFFVCSFILLFRKEPLTEKALYLFPYFFILFCSYVFRFCFHTRHEYISAPVVYAHMTGWEYPANLFQVFRWYIVQLFYPQSIVIEWAAPISYQHVFLNNLGLFSLLALFILIFVKFAKEKICQLAAVWVLIGFAPACLASFRLPFDGVVIEPHWFIFSSIGFFILAAYFCLILLDRVKIVGGVLLFLLIFTLGAVSHAYNEIWSDQITYNLFWSKQVPSLDAPYLYLGNAYEKQGALEEAKKYYKMALSRVPSHITLYNNIGMVEDAEGHSQEAELNYKRVLKYYPRSAYSYHNLGAVYLDRGQLEKAKAYFLQALAYNPLMLQPRVGLALIALKQSDYKKAIDLCLANLDIVNDDTETLFLLIDISIHQKDFVSVKNYADRIINDQTDPKILTKLGKMMADNNIPDIALDSYMKVMHVAPDYKEAYLDLGTLLGNLGKYDQAIHIWQLGLGIDPSDQRFKSSIAKAMALKLK